jgi:hypothetical protein
MNSVHTYFLLSILVLQIVQNGNLQRGCFERQ